MTAPVGLRGTTPVLADKATLEGIPMSDMGAPAAIVIEVPDQARVEYQAEGAATFTQDGGGFRRQMVHGVPCEVDMDSEISVVSGESMSSANKGRNTIIDRDNSDDDDDDDTYDDDDDATGELHEDEEIVPEEKRPVSRRNMVVFICTLTVMIAALAKHGYYIVRRSLDDGSWFRCWQFIFYPWILFVGYFAFYVIISSILALIGPVGICLKNTKFCSTIPPPPLKGNVRLPRITVQIPVYKESFKITLKPTLLSILDACWKYKLQGGRPNVIVYDDGLQLISPEERYEREQFYKKHKIGYVARPGTGRKGSFKKASNLNFGMNLGLEIERRVAIGQGKLSYKAAMKQLKEESNHIFLAGGSLHLSDFLLLIDSDTRIPEDSFLPILTELRGAPHVAFLQCLTYPMQQIHNYWENAISHFTRMVYSVAIQVACSGGDPAPLVGHNVFIRWSAMKEVAVPNEEECQWKFWSESCVSEDFDYSMRIQSKGYIGRYATYTNDWLEGVSLTVHDEITRFKKYAFGATEMLFNPIRQWPRKGVLSSVFWRYLRCRKVPLPAKVAVTAYLGTYFAIASSPIGCIVNYFAWQYIPVYHDEVLSVLDVMAYTAFVFSIFAPLGIIVTKYRLNVKWSMWQDFKHTFTFIIFFSGLGYHLLVAMVGHMLSLKMSFGITIKEITQTNFLKEVRETIRTYWVIYVWWFVIMAMLVGFWFAPPPYQIRNVYSVFPMCWLIFFHIFAPIVLNPVLMLVQW